MEIKDVGKTVADALQCQDFHRRVIVVPLPIVDIGKAFGRQFGLEGKPLVQVETRFKYGEVIVRVAGDKSQRVIHTLTLKKAVGGKTTEKLDKVLVVIRLDRALVDCFQYPCAFDTLKIISLHHPRLDEYPFDLYGRKRSISYQVHIFFLIKQERIIVLFGKQVIVHPMMFVDFQFFFSIVVGQREFHTLTL